LIAPGDIPCRALDLNGFKPARPTPLLWPEAAGIVDWQVLPAAGVDPVWGRRPAIVFDTPKGERFTLDLATAKPSLSEQALTRQLLHPIVVAMRELDMAGIAHRAIRPGNLFRSSDASDASLVLGECVSMPPGFGQPALYEPIEHLGADPLGRGPGTTADDLYALGILAALLHFGADPTFGWDAERIAQAKISQGTFVLLAGREKMAPSMAELLRGLLADHRDGRWGVKQLEAWVKGQQTVPVQASTMQRATRPMSFAGQDQMSKTGLAHAMSAHWAEALKLADTPDLENWLRRGFAEEKAGDELARIRVRAASLGPTAAIKDRIVARLCMMLDPAGPIRYRDVRSDLLGLGVLMSRMVGREDMAAQLSDMLRGRLHFAWLEARSSLTNDHIQARRTLETLDKQLDRPGPGFGVERALYELEPGAPCRSPLIGDYYVTSARDLLPAIDAVVPDLSTGELPMDRHIAAFIGARLMRSTDRELGMLYTENDVAGQAVAVLRLFAMVQYVHPNSDLPRLAALMAGALRPALEKFHNRATRAAIERQVRRHAAGCDFGALAGLFEPEGAARRKDTTDFMLAKRAFSATNRYASWLEQGGLTDRRRVREISARFAAGSSAFIASAALTAYCVWAIW
jgi:hypothetical protein